MSGTLAGAYSATGAAWEAGPGRIYNRLAELLVDASPVPVHGRTVLDVGAGTGAASRALASAGAAPIGLDSAFGMLAADRARRPPAVQGDAVRLPFRSRMLGGVVAAFSLNHAPDPVAALRECARACRDGAPIIASVYAATDSHPVKQAVQAALAERGFEPAPWAVTLYRDVVPMLADTDRFADAGAEAGLAATVRPMDVAFPELSADDLVEWRFGMAQHAPFVAGLAPGERDAVRARALDLLGTPPVLVRSTLVLTAIVR